MSDVCVTSNCCCLDEVIFQLWLLETTQEDALVKICNIEKIDTEDEKELLRWEIKDQYSQCDLIEKYFEHPDKLAEHCSVELSKEVALRLTQYYYDFDDAVVREFLGKKLTSRARKDLDDVSLKTKVSLRSCKRQFDNFRRVFKAVEDLKGYLATNISNQFLLSEQLASKYAAAVFITNQRFETTKKKLHYLSFADFAYCAELMIKEWSYSSTESDTVDMDVDLDKNFLHQLRGLKNLQDKETGELIKRDVIREVQSVVSKGTLGDLNSNFKNYFKNLLSLASDLYHSRDLRDFFLDIVEKFIEPMRSANWTYNEAEAVISSLKRVVSVSGATERQNNLSQTASWDRYMRVVTASILRMYGATEEQRNRLSESGRV